jgi:hypothetical protein
MIAESTYLTRGVSIACRDHPLLRSNRPGRGKGKVAEFFATLPNLGGCLGGCWQSTRRKQHIKRQGFATCRRVLCHVATRSDLKAHRSEKSIALRLRVIDTHATYGRVAGADSSKPRRALLDAPAAVRSTPPSRQAGNWRRAKRTRGVKQFLTRSTPSARQWQRSSGYLRKRGDMSRDVSL